MNMEHAAQSMEQTNILGQCTKWSAVATIFALPISTSITVILFFLTSLLVLATGQWRYKFDVIRSNRPACFMMGFYLLFLIGSLYSIGTFHDIEKQCLKFSWLLLAPLWIPLFTQKQWQDRAINAFLIVMTATLFLGYLKFHHWLPINPNFWAHLAPRLDTSTVTVFKDHLIQGFLMSIATSIFLFRFIETKKWPYGLLALAGAISVLLMGRGRTGYILMLLLLSFTFFNQLGFKKGIIYTFLLLATFATIITVLPSPAKTRAKIAIEDVHQYHRGNETTSLGYRYAWMKNAVSLIKERPIIGYGTGSIKAAYATLPQKDTQKTGIVGNASNEYLNIMLQFGAIGLFILLAMLFMQWRYSVLLPNDLKFLMQITLIALCVGNLANSWLMDFTQAHFYAIFFAVVFSRASNTISGSKSRIQR